MRNLDPKTVWLFFFNYLWIIYILLLSLFGYFIPVLVELFNLKILTGVLLLGGVFYLVPSMLLSYLFAHLSYKNWKYELADKALKIEKGIIFKKYISIPYTRIQNVDIYRGLLARLLGLSDIQIQTAGYSAPVGGKMFSSEGRLPGLSPSTAEDLREDLVQKIDRAPQGL